MGFVPSNRSALKVGAACGLALVMAMPTMSCFNAIMAWYPAMPKWFEFLTDIHPLPTASAFLRAIFMTNGATTKPSPLSPSTDAVLGVSWTIFMFGFALIRPISQSRTYPGSFMTPWESTPRKSAEIRTSAATSA